MKLFTKWICIALAILFILPCFAALVSADWYDEVSGGSYAPIIGEPYVAETFCGVEARYSLTTEAYQCNELIMRFYKEAYGLDVLAYINIGLVMVTEGYEFVTPSAPKKGDIIYSPAKFRQYKSDHWAIVKDYSGGKITLFEQNVKWNGKAGTGRKLNYPSEYYYVYTPVAKAGYPAPALNVASATTRETESQLPAFVPVTETTTETTTAPGAVTAIPEESTSGEAVTTAAQEDTTSAALGSAKSDEQTSTAAHVTEKTTVPETSAKPETTAAPETVTAAPGSTAVSEERALPAPLDNEIIPVEETDIMLDESEDLLPATATDTGAATSTDTEPATETEAVTEETEPPVQEDNSKNKKYVLFVVVAAAFTVIAAAGVALAAMKKRR